MMGSETRKQNSCSFIVQRPAGNAVGCDGSFLYIAYTRKNELFAQSKSSLATSPRLTGYGSRQNLEGVCSSTLRVIAAKFEGRRWSVPRGLAWDEGAQAISVAFFPDGNNLCCIAKKRVRPPRLKRNLETQDHPRPSLGSEDYAQ